jgi:SAM-dependent methyltransferase
MNTTVGRRPLLAKVEGRLAMNPRMNPSRGHLAKFIARAAESMKPGQKVLDAGAGDCRYRVHFPEQVYESADFAQVEKDYGEVGELTYVCSLDAIPVEDSRYDMVLLTQVMEHIPNPGEVLAEIRRVLKPEGMLWLSAPLFYPEHEQPYDFFRYTQFGHQRLLEAAGFEVVEIDWLEGYFATLGYQLQAGFFNLPGKPSAFGRGPIGWGAWGLTQMIRPMLLTASVAFALMDHHAKHTKSGMCKNYTVVAQAT